MPVTMPSLLLEENAMSLKRGSLMAKVESSRSHKVEDCNTSVHIGDIVDIHSGILAGVEKGGRSKREDRVFRGTVIAIKGSGRRESLTVRRVVDGQGVEHTFPIHSPKIAKIVVKRQRTARHTKQQNLRDRHSMSRRNPYHSYLGVNLPEPTGKPTISARTLTAAIKEVVSLRK